MIKALVLSFLLPFAFTAAAETLTGKATVVDGDTVRIGDLAVNLYGIDAPELGQICTDQKGKQFNCGHASMRRLFLYIGGDPLDCKVKSRGTDGVLNATCRVISYFIHTENGATRGEKFDVALEMVLTGHAFAHPDTADYAVAEKKARHDLKGFWKGTFSLPWEWRRISAKHE